MKVGLVRHFEISMPTKKAFMSSEEFADWVRQYELSGIKTANGITSLSGWPNCYCSSSERTVHTANLLYDGLITHTDLIKEVPIAPVFQTTMKLPMPFWFAVGRLAWKSSHKSQPETLSATSHRVKYFISQLLSSKDSDVLVVSHGFIMKLIRKELLANGFRGDKFIWAKHGKLYVYER